VLERALDALIQRDTRVTVPAARRTFTTQRAPLGHAAPDGRTYVGTSVEEGGGLSAKIVQPGSDSVITIADAVLGSIAATNDGVAALLYDPASTDARAWMSVQRFDATGAARFATVEPVWVDLAPAAGARITGVKTTRYGAGDLLLLGWSETTGSSFNGASTTYAMVADRAGAICQAKQALAEGQSFLQTDDVIRRADGTIVWANAQSGTASLVTLVPE
jgi:hypothetical protein